MNGQKEKVDWTKCPGCGKFIPKTWNRHELCGWKAGDVDTSKSVALETQHIIQPSDEALKLVSESVREADNLIQSTSVIDKRFLNATLSDVLNLADQIRKTKLTFKIGERQ